MDLAQKPVYKLDLAAGTSVVNLTTPLVEGDDRAQTFTLELTDKGDPANLNGYSVTAYFGRGKTADAEADTIPVPGTVSGNVATITLTESCYSRSCYFSMPIRLSNGATGQKRTYLIVRGTVVKSVDGTIIDPDGSVPSLDDLFAQIAVMERSRQAAEEATEEALAAAARADEAREGIQGDLAALTEDIAAIDSPVQTAYVSGNITNGGTVNTTSTTRIRSAKPILITGGMRWTIDEQYRASVAIYNDAAFTAANFAGFVGGSTSQMYYGDIFIPAEYTGKYMGIRIEKYGHETENISGDLATIGEYVKLHDLSEVLSVGNFRQHYGDDLHNVLSANNYRQYVTDDNRQFLPIRRASSFDWNWGTTILEGGEERDAIRGALTNLLPVAPNTAILNASPAVDHKDRQFDVYVAEFTDGVFVKRTKIDSGTIHTTDSETTGVKLLAVYPSSITVEMTSTNLMTNFAVGFVGNIIPGDGQRPKYVAFGASTTVGAVQHMNNKSVTYSPYAFPDYIGQILGLDTTNLGNGTTGFIARDDGAKPNFMDAIYNNPDVLAEADLITLMFGYGNDKTAELPFGAWDDYFPYDEVGAFFVEGNATVNKNGITRMLENGATLMGCLNWCIKWIGEHYPKATLVCLFGAPSGNGDYKVEVITNAAAGAGTTNVPSHKISVQGKELDEETDMNVAVDTLRKMLNIPIINLFNDGLPFSYYNTKATNDDGTYAVFSTKGTADAPVWNSHPNEVGYLMYARYLAGRVSEYFKH